MVYIVSDTKEFLRERDVKEWIKNKETQLMGENGGPIKKFGGMQSDYKKALMKAIANTGQKGNADESDTRSSSLVALAASWVDNRNVTSRKASKGSELDFDGQAPILFTEANMPSCKEQKVSF